MTIAFFAVILAMAIWAVSVLIRVYHSDARLVASLVNLNSADPLREKDLEQIDASVASVGLTLDQWTKALDARIRQAEALSRSGARIEKNLSPVRQLVHAISLDLATEELARPGLEEPFARAHLAMTVSALRRAPNPQNELPSLQSTLGLSPTHDVVFAVPTLGESPSKRSSAWRAVAAEDTLATNAMAQALLTRWPEAEVRMEIVDAGHVAVPEAHNLIAFCRNPRNPVTQALLQHEQVRSRLYLGFPVLKHDDGGPSEWGIQFGATTYRSPSYEEERRLRLEGRDRTDGELEDLALLARFTNPFEPTAKAFVVAGIRAFGTWGAAEYLRTCWDELYKQVGGEDFACVVRVRARFRVGVIRGDDVEVSVIPDESPTFEGIEVLESIKVA